MRRPTHKSWAWWMFFLVNITYSWVGESWFEALLNACVAAGVGVVLITSALRTE